jgi:hypothetical protein
MGKYCVIMGCATNGDTVPGTGEDRRDETNLYEPMRQYRSTEYEGKEEGVKL